MAGSADCRPARNKRNVRKAPATRGGARPRATLRAGPENKREAAAVRFPGTGEKSDGDGEKTFGEPDAQPGEWRSLAGGDHSGGDGGRAEDDVSPAGNGGEGGGALHGVANEAEVVGQIGSEVGAVGPGPRVLGGATEAAGAMLARFEHEGRVTGDSASVKYFLMQSKMTTQRTRRKNPWAHWLMAGCDVQSFAARWTAQGCCAFIKSKIPTSRANNARVVGHPLFLSFHHLSFTYLPASRPKTPTPFVVPT